MSETHDHNGREYAKINSIAQGDTVALDDGFTCMKGTREVMLNEVGLYVQCSHGCHYIDGQANKTATHYIGFFKL